MRIVFMGSPDFAVPSLKALIDGHTVVGVVTQPDRPAGRGQHLTPPPVKEVAEAHSISVIQPKSLKREDALEQLSDWEPDIIAVAAFGQILPQAALDIPPFGCVNVHASLLPRWRGAAPIQAAILHGDNQTGVTIMKMDAGLDTGPILRQRSVPILDRDTAGSMSEKLADLGAQLLADTLPAYTAGELELQPQDDDQATLAPMLRKADGRMQFDLPAVQLERMVRAYDPWPGTHFYWRGRRIAVHSAQAVAATRAAEAGSTTVYQDLPAIQTGDGLLVLHTVQPAGSRPMPGSAFLNGAQDFPDGTVDPGPEQPAGQ